MTFIRDEGEIKYHVALAIAVNEFRIVRMSTSLRNNPLTQNMTPPSPRSEYGICAKPIYRLRLSVDNEPGRNYS